MGQGVGALKRGCWNPLMNYVMEFDVCVGMAMGPPFVPVFQFLLIYLW